MPEFDGYKYILLVIDVFSKHMYARPLKDKSAKTVGEAFEDIYNEFQSPIFKLESDNVMSLNKFNLQNIIWKTRRETVLCKIFTFIE